MRVNLKLSQQGYTGISMTYFIEEEWDGDEQYWTIYERIIHNGKPDCSPCWSYDRFEDAVEVAKDYAKELKEEILCNL